MNRTKVASELLVLAKTLVASKELVSITITDGEGNTSVMNRAKGKSFKSVKDVEKYMERNFEKPSFNDGYNKIFLQLKFDDDTTMRVRYDHGEDQPSLGKVLKRYL
jgi:hypothetical protein